MFLHSEHIFYFVHFFSFFDFGINSLILFEIYFESPWITLTTSQGNRSLESKSQAHVTQTICTRNMMTIQSASASVDVQLSIVHRYTHQYLHWINSHTATVSVSQRKPHSSLNQEVESVSQHPFCVTGEVGQTYITFWQRDCGRCKMTYCSQ